MYASSRDAPVKSQTTSVGVFVIIISFFVLVILTVLGTINNVASLGLIPALFAGALWVIYGPTMSDVGQIGRSVVITLSVLAFVAEAVLLIVFSFDLFNTIVNGFTLSLAGTAAQEFAAVIIYLLVVILMAWGVTAVVKSPRVDAGADEVYTALAEMGAPPPPQFSSYRESAPQPRRRGRQVAQVTEEPDDNSDQEDAPPPDKPKQPRAEEPVSGTSIRRGPRPKSPDPTISDWGSTTNAFVAT
jgi:hypothetical protein